MAKSCRASRTRRVAIGLVAVYGLLLQAYLGTMAPASWFGSAEACSSVDRSREVPAGDPPRHDCLCCTVLCATGGCGALPTTVEAEFPFRPGDFVAFVLGHQAFADLSARFPFTARGPPEPL